MREIKFRAWLNPRWEDDDDANRMYYDIQDSYDNLGNVKPYDPMTSFASWFNDEAAIVEQCTGLKDKNGKEIYEGDIVEYVTHYYGNEQRHRKVVEWEEWDSDDFGEPHNLGYSNLSEGMDVIGNIHENPELLGGEE